MARKSRVRRRIKARHTRRRQVTGGESDYLTDVQFNEQADSFSSIGFSILLRFNSGNVYYGDINVGTYKSPLKDGSYTVYKIEPSQRLYGRPLTEKEVEKHEEIKVKTKHEEIKVKTKPDVKKSSSYYGRISALITPGSSIKKDKKPPHSTFSSSE